MKIARALVLALLVTVPVPSSARADAPPDDGLKYIGNTFTVTGLAGFPDHVIVAWPWSASNGAPTREHALMKEGEPVHIGRRSPDISLWAVRRDAWATFERTLPPDEDARASALDAFMRAPNAVLCDQRPMSIDTTAEDDPREVIDHAFIARVVSDSACKLDRPGPPPASKPSGCGACAGGDASGLVWLGAVSALLVRGRARARRGRG